jgi:hypothetical protein
MDYVIENYIGISMNFLRRPYKYVCIEYIYTVLQNSLYVEYVIES